MPVYRRGSLHEHHFHNYRALLSKVEAFHQSLLASYGAEIACRLGCQDCCSEGLTFLAVEFCYLLQGLKKRGHPLQALLRSRLLAATRSPEKRSCVLLHQGACLLYEFRPIICRTHGFPLLLREAGTELRDCCPRNFQVLTLSRLPLEALLDLEKLTAMLIAVNLEFTARLGMDPRSRRPLTELLTWL